MKNKNPLAPHADELRAMRNELSSLRASIESLCHKRENEIFYALKRRGFAFQSANPTERLLSGPNRSPAAEEALYEKLKKYSFRLFVRDVVAREKPFKISEVTKYSTRETSIRYIAFLRSLGIVEKVGADRFSLSSHSVYNFGDTFEWFVAKLFENEFHVPSAWGVKLKETKSGGDFDVIVFIEGNLVYVEVKSSPPKHIEQNEVAAFFNRIDDLKPDLSIFVEDTRLRMRDKIVVMFEEELNRRMTPGKRTRYRMNRVLGEIFSFEGKIFISNSKPDIASNLGVCIQSLLRRGAP
ncbi:MAG: hypothetical protein QME66_12105 [Candidatus Eisenbacteria bacterium]|nr:hypothetical protein [Candidatus Eisenbacteria bacterium]